MYKGSYKGERIQIALGSHLGSFSEEDSTAYKQALEYALTHGIHAVDTAINYRGMKAEKDTGEVLQLLMKSGIVQREEIQIATKAGLLFGDIDLGLPPRKYLQERLAPKGITEQDFVEFEGLLHTLNPAFYQAALDISLKNLGVDTIDIHYIHMPEVSKAYLGVEMFYTKMRQLFEWYESMADAGRIQSYGIALELACMEPEDQRWNINLERLYQLAEEIAGHNSHFQYIQLPYNPACLAAVSVINQIFSGETISLTEAAKRLGLRLTGSMPFAMGDSFTQYTLEELLDFSFEQLDSINCGSKSIKHIGQIIQYLEKKNKR